MNRPLALALQAALVLAGCVTLGLLLIEPHFEGRNANATFFAVYLHDPFLAYVYVGSIPFFVALTRAFTLLGDVRRSGVFSDASVHRLRAIQRCALIVAAFVLGALGFVLLLGDPGDRPPGVVMCGLVIVAATIAAAAARMMANRLKDALRQAARRKA